MLISRAGEWMERVKIKAVYHSEPSAVLYG